MTPLRRRAPDTVGPGRTRLTVRRMVRNTAFVVLSAAVLFSAVGRVDWMMGWLFVGVMAASKATTVLIVLRTSPELILERFQARGETRNWDRPLSGIMALWGPVDTWLVAGLDARYSSSPPLPLWLAIGGVAIGGVAIALLGSLLATWAMASNPDFAGTTLIQPRPEQRMAASGPYAKIRHPGYAGFLLFSVVTPFVLGSLWSLIPATMTCVVVFVRTALEDRTLREELEMGTKSTLSAYATGCFLGYGSYALRSGEADLHSGHTTKTTSGSAVWTSDAAAPHRPQAGVARPGPRRDKHQPPCDQSAYASAFSRPATCRAGPSTDSPSRESTRAASRSSSAIAASALRAAGSEPNSRSTLR